MNDFDFIKVENIEDNPLLQNMMDENLKPVMERGNSVTCYLKNSSSKEN